MFEPIAKCPDCGCPIYEGHVSHICPTEPTVVQTYPFTVTMSFGPFDTICVPRDRIGEDKPEDTPPEAR